MAVVVEARGETLVLRPGPGSFAVCVDRTRTGLTDAEIGWAVSRLDPASAVYQLLETHLTYLRAMGAFAAPLVEEATVELVRALLVDALGVPVDERLAAVQRWILRNLSDSALTPQRVAAAHGMSLRTLYNLWSSSPITLTEWIIRRRLEAVSRELVDPRAAARPIAVVARRWGFRDAAHFSRRFRAAYGRSPREWRRTGRHERDADWKAERHG